MAFTIKPIGKAIIIVAILGAGFFGYQFAEKKGLVEKIAPAGKQQAASTMTPEAKKAAKEGAPIINVGVVTWGGYAGGQYFNGSFGASTDSAYYKEYGILVNFILNDDYKSSRDAFKAGKVDALWTTADSIVTEVESMKNENIVILFQSDWSRGGDAIVSNFDIKTVTDLRGKKIAVALGSPSHSFLLKTLEASNMSEKDITVVTTDSALVAAQEFKSGQVDAAVVWSPDDEDCVRSVTGSKVLVSTKKAGNIISDVFYVKKAWLEKNRKTADALIAGWMRGAAEINSNPAAKEKAAKILMAGLNIDEELARKSIDNVRLTTIGDNINFFGLNPAYKGVKGEDLYNKMHAMYVKTTPPLAPVNVPMWRNITDTSSLQSVKLTGAEHNAENTVTFAAPTKIDETAPAYANKPVTVTFASGSAELTADSKTLIDIQFGDIAKNFSQSRIRIEGNTDTTGKRESNIALSKRRADSVANYLSQRYGFDYNRFVIVGHGPDNPVVGCESNSSTECLAKNRRTDFLLL